MESIKDSNTTVDSNQPNTVGPGPTFLPIQGEKYDAGKIRIELIPSEFIFATAQVLTFGANKYAARNWEKGIQWSRVFGALMRHMWCWWAGKEASTRNFLFDDNDFETGYSHLWHAACCLAFLITFEERDMTEFDDRFTVEASQ